MASLVYPVITSLDGYVVDADGGANGAWRKVVYSTTLDTMSTSRTRLEHTFDRPPYGGRSTCA